MGPWRFKSSIDSSESPLPLPPPKFGGPEIRSPDPKITASPLPAPPLNSTDWLVMFSVKLIIIEMSMITRIFILQI
jgi:hypothetical protein